MLREYWVGDPSDEGQRTTYNYKFTAGPITFCKTLHDAEQAMGKMIEEQEPREEDDEVTVCYMIREVPYGIMVYPESVLQCLSARMYNADGELVEQNLCTGFCYEGEAPKSARFYGRSPEMMRFQPGDIVQVTRLDSLSLGIVVATPLTTDECWRIRQNTIKTMKKKFCKDEEPSDEDVDSMYGPDISDDCYIIVDGPGYEYHRHISSMYLLEPAFPVPDELRQKLMSDYKITMKEYK